MYMPTTSHLAWLLPVLFAPFVGSFLGVLIIRLPTGEPVVWGRSACPHCGKRLGPRDLLPLVSWTLNRGRCRHCGARLDWLYPAVELAALGVAIWSAAVLSGWLVAATAAYGWALLTLAWIDQRHEYVPDVINLPLIPAGLLTAWFAVPEFWIDHLIGAIAGFALLLLVREIYRRLRGRTGLGFGDVKLLAGIGAWVAWQGLASVVLIAALSGLLLAAVRHRKGQPLELAGRLAFGPHLALAGWLVWLYGPFNLAS
jgi:leader peptidase (prepilin peptidase) / N-methyltransferase